MKCPPREFFHQLSCVYGAENKYTLKAVELVLENGGFPKNLYALTAKALGATPSAVSRGISRATPILWEKGAGVFHKADAPCPKPLEVLAEIVFYLSDKKILG